jgi:hypothetical protein
MRKFPVLIGIAAVLVMATTSPALAAGGWMVQYPPNPPGSIDASLDAVSCVHGAATSADCMAVGNYENPVTQITPTLAESWNGSSWTIQPTPIPSGASGATLYDVSCTAATFCEAVGVYGYPNGGGLPYPLAEGWNGTSWIIQPTPALGIGGVLYGVSCVSASFCVAAGAYLNSSYVAVNVAEEWNGSTWSQMPMATPISGNLARVSCPSAQYCVAVGGNLDTGAAESVIWSNGTWSPATVPQPAGDSLTALASVSCPSVGTCTAVGSTFDSSGTQQVVAERWNGTAWTVQQPINGDDGGSQLNGVSCPTTTSCTAIGNSGLTDSLAETWNGSTWTIESIPDPDGPASPNGISCITVTSCNAVGNYFPDNGDITDTLAYLEN